MKGILLLIAIVLCQPVKAQNSVLDSSGYDSIRNLEYHLEGLSYNIINGPDVKERITSCYYFIETLKKALSVPGSYTYTFTSLRTVSILKPDDDRFRIFTWNLLLDSGKYMYFGAIQMNSVDSLVLFGLYDSSEYNKDIHYASYDARHWMGALYYQVHHYRHKGDDQYVLFGWDGQDARTNRKIIDVLWFNEAGEPQFGKEVFDVDGDLQSRLIFDFANHASMICRYDAKEKKIVFANLVPISPFYEGRPEAYVPDGTYDYLELEKGIWYRHPFLFEDRKDHSFDLRRE